MTKKKYGCITSFGMMSIFLSQPGGVTSEMLLPPGESTMMQALNGTFEVIEIEHLCSFCKHCINKICRVGGGQRAVDAKCNISKSKEQFIPMFELGSHMSKVNILQPADYEKYDAILVNVSGALMPHVHKIRNEIGYGSSTQLFGNMDHGIDIASHHFPSYPQLKAGLGLLDMIFSVEPTQRSFVKRMLPMRTIHDIPHCLDIPKHKVVGDMFKEHRDQANPKNIVVTYHSYEHPILMPLAAMADPRLKDMKPLLGGYDFSCATCMVRAQCPNKREGGVCDKYVIGFEGFGEGLHRKNYPTHMKEMAISCNIGYESFQVASISRYGMQWAAMGIPGFVPGCCRSHSLFDYEPTSPKNLKQIGNILSKIKQNRKGWTDELIETAYNRVQDQYSFKVVADKIVAALEQEEQKDK